MINLLPPPMKNQLKYAKINRHLIKYVWVAVIVLGLMLAMFGVTFFLIHREIGITQAKLADQEEAIKVYGNIEKEAESLADRLKAISDVQKNQNHFSELFKELASLTPSDVSIESLQIDSEKSTATLTAISNNYTSAAGLRNQLAKSTRFNNVDIVDFKQPENGQGYEIRITIGLKKGAAK